MAQKQTDEEKILEYLSGKKEPVPYSRAAKDLGIEPRKLRQTVRGMKDKIRREKDGRGKSISLVTD